MIIQDVTHTALEIWGDKPIHTDEIAKMGEINLGILSNDFKEEPDMIRFFL